MHNLRDPELFDPSLLETPAERVARQWRERDHRRRYLTPGQRMVLLSQGDSFVARFGATGLISYWKLEEASGSRADSWGTNTLTDNNTVTQQTGKLGNCGQFTAANSEYLSKSSATFTDGLSALSIAGWVYFDSVGSQQSIWQKWASNQAQFAFELWTGNVLICFVADSVADTGGNYGLGTTALSASTWYHLAVVFDGSLAAANRLKIYINGSLDGLTITGTIPTNTTTSTQDLEFGRDAAAGPARYLNGREDSIGVWRRALLGNEIAYLYNNGNGRAIVGSEP